MPESIYLSSVYNAHVLDGNIKFLYELLKERPKHASISHIEMPNYNNHRNYVLSMPYKYWLIVWLADRRVGSVYITVNNEIGLFIQKKDQGRGYGSNVIKTIFRIFQNDIFFANINPDNHQSIKFFKSLGFKHVQNTYRIELK